MRLSLRFMVYYFYDQNKQELVHCFAPVALPSFKSYNNFVTGLEMTYINRKNDELNQFSIFRCRINCETNDYQLSIM